MKIFTIKQISETLYNPYQVEGGGITRHTVGNLNDDDSYRVVVLVWLWINKRGYRCKWT